MPSSSTPIAPLTRPAAMKKRPSTASVASATASASTGSSAPPTFRCSLLRSITAISPDDILRIIFQSRRACAGGNVNSHVRHHQITEGGVGERAAVGHLDELDAPDGIGFQKQRTLRSERDV